MVSRLLKAALLASAALAFAPAAMADVVMPEAGGYPALGGFRGSLVLGHSSLQSTVRFPQVTRADGSVARNKEQFNDIGGNSIEAGLRLGWSSTGAGFFYGADLTGTMPINIYPTTILNAAGFSYERTVRWNVAPTVRAGWNFDGRTALFLQGGAVFLRNSVLADGQVKQFVETMPRFGFGAEHALTERLSMRMDATYDRGTHAIEGGRPGTTTWRPTYLFSIAYRF